MAQAPSGANNPDPTMANIKSQDVDEVEEYYSDMVRHRGRSFAYKWWKSHGRPYEFRLFLLFERNRFPNLSDSDSAEVSEGGSKDFVRGEEWQQAELDKQRRKEKKILKAQQKEAGKSQLSLAAPSTTQPSSTMSSRQGVTGFENVNSSGRGSGQTRRPKIAKERGPGGAGPGKLAQLFSGSDRTKIGEKLPLTEPEKQEIPPKEQTLSHSSAAGEGTRTAGSDAEAEATPEEVQNECDEGPEDRQLQSRSSDYGGSQSPKAKKVWLRRQATSSKHVKGSNDTDTEDKKLQSGSSGSGSLPKLSSTSSPAESKQEESREDSTEKGKAIDAIPEVRKLRGLNSGLTGIQGTGGKRKLLTLGSNDDDHPRPPPRHELATMNQECFEPPQLYEGDLSPTTIPAQSSNPQRNQQENARVSKRTAATAPTAPNAPKKQRNSTATQLAQIQQNMEENSNESSRGSEEGWRVYDNLYDTPPTPSSERSLRFPGGESMHSQSSSSQNESNLKPKVAPNHPARIALARTPADPSHPLYYKRGVVFCLSCGGYGVRVLGATLVNPCKGKAIKGTQGFKNKERMLGRGLPPSNLRAGWPLAVHEAAPEGLL